MAVKKNIIPIAKVKGEQKQCGMTMLNRVRFVVAPQ